MGQAQTPDQQMVVIDLSDLDPPEAWVNINANKSWTANFTATVSVQKPPGMDVTVHMSGFTDQGWPMWLNPKVLDFTVSHTQYVSISVEVPPRTPTSTVENVYVTATADFLGGQVSDTSSGIARARQYYGVHMSCGQKTATENPSEYPITVQNTGNGPDTIRLSVKDEEKHRAKGLTFKFSKTVTDELDIFQTDAVSLKVGFGPEAPEGQYTFNVLGSSIAEDLNGSYEEDVDFVLTLTMDVRHSPLGDVPLIYIVTIVIVIAVLVVFIVVKRKRRFIGRKNQVKKSKRKTK